jgi:hypothetical protein
VLLLAMKLHWHGATNRSMVTDTGTSLIWSRGGLCRGLRCGWVEDPVRPDMFPVGKTVGPSPRLFAIGGVVALRGCYVSSYGIPRVPRPVG